MPGSNGSPRERDVYGELGVAPIINGRGAQTVLGGSMLSPRVLAAMEAANQRYADMETLLKRAGKVIAEMLECEAVYVTPGCAAAVALGTAACIARSDPAKIAQIPATTGMPNEILVQKRQVMKYTRLLSVGGGRTREVGDATGTSAAQLEAAIGPNTAAVHCAHSPALQEGCLPLAELAAIAHAHDLPVLVDAAGSVFPPELMREPMRQGGDLVGFGAKYFGAPNSTGLLCGRRDLVDSAARQGFIGFELGNGDAFGRAMKLDRQEVVAVVEALREWRSMNHAERIERGVAQAQLLVTALDGAQGLRASLNRESGCAEVRLEAASAHTTDSLAAALRGGSPPIWARVEDDGRYLAFVGATLLEGEPEIVADRVRAIVSG